MIPKVGKRPPKAIEDGRVSKPVVGSLWTFAQAEDGASLLMTLSREHGAGSIIRDLHRNRASNRGRLIGRPLYTDPGLSSRIATNVRLGRSD